jgi:hypothetical protein
MGSQLDEGVVLLQGADACLPVGRKNFHALHSHMSALEFLMEPPINCPNSNVGDSTFVKSIGFIRGRDVIEEYLTCGLYPLVSVFSAPGNNRVFKITCFRFRGGLTNN